jgi:hypothetical protein
MAGINLAPSPGKAEENHSHRNDRWRPSLGLSAAARNARYGVIVPPGGGFLPAGGFLSGVVLPPVTLGGAVAVVP